MKKLACFIASLFLLCPALALAWAPKDEVSVIVAYMAGSGTDTGARLLAAQAEKHVGQHLAVRNFSGGDGKIGWTRLVNAKPDGQTIGFINLPSFPSIASQPDAPFGVEDIVPIANHLTETGVVVVSAKSPYKNLKGLAEAAKANPGLRASTNGVRASNHIAAQLLGKSGGFSYKAIPYSSTSSQLRALQQGEVDFSCAKISDVAHLIKGPKAPLRLLGVFAEERLNDYPEIPTLGEQGFYDKWYGAARGLVLPKGTPEEIVKFYSDAFAHTMKDPANIAAHRKAGLNLDYLDRRQFAKLIENQTDFCKNELEKLFSQ